MAEELVTPTDDEFYQGEQDFEFPHIVHARGWIWCVACGKKIPLRASEAKFDGVEKVGTTEFSYSQLDDDGSPIDSQKTERVTTKIPTISSEQFFDQHSHDDMDLDDVVAELQTKMKE